MYAHNGQAPPAAIGFKISGGKRRAGAVPLSKKEGNHISVYAKGEMSFNSALKLNYMAEMHQSACLFMHSIV